MLLMNFAYATRCGPGLGKCESGGCSIWGWCGFTNAHLSGECLPEYSEGPYCTPLVAIGPIDEETYGLLNGTVTTSDRCGADHGNTVCAEGFCCSKWGFCGDTEAHCGISSSTTTVTQDSGTGSTVSPPTETNVPPQPSYIPTDKAIKLPLNAPVKSCVNDKHIVVTLDDGPHNTITEDSINQLIKYKIPATFFHIGVHLEKRFEGSKALRDALIAHPELFTVAVHTYYHLDSVQIQEENEGRVLQEATQGMSAICEAYGVKPRFFRPPYGSWNQETLQIWNDMGFYTINWDIDTNGDMD